MTASDKECTSQDDVVPGSALTMTPAEIVRVAISLGGSEGTGHDDPHIKLTYDLVPPMWFACIAVRPPRRPYRYLWGSGRTPMTALAALARQLQRRQNGLI